MIANHSVVSPERKWLAAIALGDGTPLRLREVAPADGHDAALELVAADASDRVHGRASYRRVYGPRAVLSLDVHDGLWGAGLANELLAAIRRHGAGAGIATFLVRVPAADRQLLALLDGERAARSPRDDGDVDVDLPVRSSPATPRPGALCGSSTPRRA